VVRLLIFSSFSSHSIYICKFDSEVCNWKQILKRRTNQFKVLKSSAHLKIHLHASEEMVLNISKFFFLSKKEPFGF